MFQDAKELASLGVKARPPDTSNRSFLASKKKVLTPNKGQPSIHYGGKRVLNGYS